MVVGNAHLDAVYRLAHAAYAPLAHQGVGSDDCRLRHPIALEHDLAGALLEIAVGVGQQRRRSRNEQPHVGAAGGREAGLVQQAGVERGHAHHHRGPGQQGKHLLRVEFLQKQQPAARKQGAVPGNEQSMRMEQRQRVQQHVVAAETPELGQRQAVAQQTGMGQHGALGATGGARGIDDEGHVLARHLRRGERLRLRLGQPVQRSAALLGQRHHMGHAMGPRQLAAGREVRRLADENPGLGVGQEIRELVGSIGGVQRQVDGAHAQRCEVKAIVARRLVDLHRHPVAGANAQADQCMGVARGAGQHAGIADDLAVVGFEKGRVAGLACDGFKSGKDIGVHGMNGKGGCRKRVRKAR